MAVGTGFGQLFRGIGMLLLLSLSYTLSLCLLEGQVGGVAISSAIFQYKLDNALRERLWMDPDAEQVGLCSCSLSSDLC